MKKTVLITGASRGIGRAAAVKFAHEGFCVAVNYRENAAAAEKALIELRNSGAECAAFRADISQEDDVRRMFDEVKSTLGEVDVLVNNAGIALPQGLFTDFSDRDCRRVFDTNVMGMMNCCRAAVPDFVRRHSGSIVNISSIWGICGGSCEVIYSAAKAAVIGFTKALAKELAPSGVRVNCVAPGFVNTEMNAHLSKADIDAFASEVPMMRICEPREVAESVFFLASGAADYITGQVLTVDGGLI